MRSDLGRTAQPVHRRLHPHQQGPRRKLPQSQNRIKEQGLFSPHPPRILLAQQLTNGTQIKTSYKTLAFRGAGVPPAVFLISTRRQTAARTPAPQNTAPPLR